MQPYRSQQIRQALIVVRSRPAFNATARPPICPLGRQSATAMQVDIQSGGTVITNSTTNTIVGAQVNLSANVQPSGLNPTYQWTVPGNPIKNYTEDTSSAAVIPLTSADTTGQSVSFYWVGGGQGLGVSCAVTVSGCTCTANATVNVARPTCTVTTSTGKVGLYQRKDGSWLLGYEAPGIAFWQTTTEPPGFTSGTTQWVQVIDNTLRTVEDTAGNWSILDKASDVLDTTYPYSTFGPGGDPEDSPFQGLIGGDLRDTASDSFSMYLMYMPGCGGIYVPLQEVDWNWSGAASWSGNSWKLDAASNNANPVGFDCRTEPEWLDNIRWTQSLAIPWGDGQMHPCGFTDVMRELCTMMCR